jgi:hypothetical protein
MVSAACTIPASPHNAIFISIKIFHFHKTTTVLAIYHLFQEAFINKELCEVEGIVRQAVNGRQRIFHVKRGGMQFYLSPNFLEGLYVN